VKRYEELRWKSRLKILKQRPKRSENIKTHNKMSM